MIMIYDEDDIWSIDHEPWYMTMMMMYDDDDHEYDEW